MRWLRMTVTACLVAAAGAFALVRFAGREVQQLTNQVSRLEQDKEKLRSHIQKLGSSRRVAQMDVIDQSTGPGGVGSTSLRWQEIDEAGMLGPPRQITVEGAQVYVEAFVVKFAPIRRGDVFEQSPSVAVFRRVFGDRQTPESGYPLTNDVNGPTGGESASKESAQIWSRFWRIIEDKQAAATYGVRVAQCEAPAVRVSAGQTWEVSLDVAGGLNIRLLGQRRVSPSQKAN